MAEWVSTEQAASQLRVSTRTLYRLRQSGVLLAGVHWLPIGPGPRAPLRYNVAACLIRLRTLALRRV